MEIGIQCTPLTASKLLKILKWPTTLAGVHPGKEFIPMADELEWEGELATLDRAFIIHPGHEGQGMGVPSVCFLA